MEFLQQMIVAVEHYPAEYVKLEIIDVDFPGDSLNESETGTFRVKVIQRVTSRQRATADLLNGLRSVPRADCRRSFPSFT